MCSLGYTFMINPNLWQSIKYHYNVFILPTVGLRVSRILESFYSSYWVRLSVSFLLLMQTMFGVLLKLLSNEQDLVPGTHQFLYPIHLTRCNDVTHKRSQRTCMIIVRMAPLRWRVYPQGQI